MNDTVKASKDKGNNTGRFVSGDPRTRECARKGGKVTKEKRNVGRDTKQTSN